jgi:anti-sigma factor RsiW
MKKCEHFKDLILTDYIDGELDKDSAGSVESHLLDCSDCRAFLKEIKNNAVISSASANVLRQPVPAELWDTIRQRIEHKDREADSLEDLIDKLKGWISFPRLVPVFASFVVMFLVGSVTLDKIQVQQAQARDQGEYLISLLSSTDISSSSDNNDQGTPIEHYFL